MNGVREGRWEHINVDADDKAYIEYFGGWRISNADDQIYADYENGYFKANETNEGYAAWISEQQAETIGTFVAGGGIRWTNLEHRWVGHTVFDSSNNILYEVFPDEEEFDEYYGSRIYGISAVVCYGEKDQFEYSYWPEKQAPY